MKIKSFVTDKNNGYRFENINLLINQKGIKIEHNPKIKYQTWLGFGGAFTESSCYNLSLLSKEKQEEALKCYFSKDGLDYNLGRMCMGSSDFSLGTYDYFIGDKLDYSRDNLIIDTIKHAHLIKKETIKLMVSPWSPPERFKDNKIRHHGGHLLNNCYEEYADYYINYLLHLKNKELDVEYISLQNEPAATQVWDSCLYSPMDEYKLARILKTKMNEKNIDYKILAWDHNRDIMIERLSPIYDMDKDNLIYGGAIHWYDNEPFNNLTILHNKYPFKHIIHSESCLEGGPHIDDFNGLIRYARNIIGNMVNYLEAYLDWNLFLDLQGGPNWVGNYCSSPILIDKEKDDFYLQPSYYTFKHFSSFIKPGSIRIETLTKLDLFHVSFLKDNEIIMVILNDTNEERIISMENENYKILPLSLTTFVIDK